MTNGQRQSKLQTHEQYDPRVAERFDRLVDWENRLANYGGFFFRILNENKAKRILDMSTGTGFDSIALAKNGFDVVSLDGSPEMIERAHINAKKYGVKLKTIVSDWRNLGNTFSTIIKGAAPPFDGATNLGNSFLHLTHPEREDVVSQVWKILAQGGVFIVDYRNYHRLTRGLPIRLEDGGYYSGKGAKMDIELRDNLVVQSYSFDDGAKFTLSFKPVFIEEAKGELESNKFSVKVYSDFREKFDPDASFYQLVGKAG